ncbi:CLUMA_CG001203, isoform A [Clunio marinus]|uniref:CLUMA_CG001203, isoform A n=1 Tax=Clunio marinus TaxID=568069 RepID=A0A1J1HME1_9DIPT|nr:CLUMA_CG001203, isoform A [Clunio marinus]
MKVNEVFCVEINRKCFLRLLKEQFQRGVKKCLHSLDDILVENQGFYVPEKEKSSSLELPNQQLVES